MATSVARMPPQLPLPSRISGPLLRVARHLLRHEPTRSLIAKVYRSELEIDQLRALPSDLREALPANQRPLAASRQAPALERKLGALPQRDWPLTAHSLTALFSQGKLTPSELTDKVIEAARRQLRTDLTLAPIHLLDEEKARAAAKAATERYAQGKQLGPLDGVPMAIKEEVDFEGLPTRLGTDWMPHTPAAADSVVVSRLRRTGAVLVGTTPMTEYGLSPLGVNPHRNMPRNAHSREHVPGGSSSGSGVAVGLGLVTSALGVDGGGSVRIPACFNGVYGLKPTFGRIAASGHGLPIGSSVGHIGPISTSTRDLALFLQATGGADDGDPASLGQPELSAETLESALEAGIEGLRVGVLESEWEDADLDVAATCRGALRELERAGATLEKVTIPLARWAPAMGYLSIGLETYVALQPLREDIDLLDQLGLDVQMLLGVLSTFPVDDYLDAQRLRGRLRQQTRDALEDYDVLVLPTTARAAPRATDQEMRDGFLDSEELAAATRFAFLGNLTGLPAGTAPVGLSSAGLPIGFQVMANAWDEATVLRVLAQLERDEVAQVKRPAAAIGLM